MIEDSSPDQRIALYDHLIRARYIGDGMLSVRLFFAGFIPLYVAGWIIYNYTIVKFG
jgi:hypothetical protein